MPAQGPGQTGHGLVITQPLVDLATATRESKQRLHARRQTDEVKAGKASVIDKHASRKSLPSRKKAPRAERPETQQLGFDF